MMDGEGHGDSGKEGQTLRFESLEENMHFHGVYDINPTELHDKMNQLGLEKIGTNLRIIDVRQPEEFVGELGHVPRSELMVLNYLPELLAEETDKNQSIVFVCRSGGRSAQATAYAQTQGFTSVYNMKGGMIFWNDLRLPTENEIGK